MLLRQFFNRVSSTYTDLIGGASGREAVIIDPVKKQTDQYLMVIEQLGLRSAVEGRR